MEPRLVSLLAFIIVVGFFGIVGTLIFHEVPAGSKDVLGPLIGVIGAAVGTIVGYLWGSSSGSKAKSDTINELTGTGNGSQQDHSKPENRDHENGGIRATWKGSTMSIFHGLLRDIRQVKHELIELLQLQEQVKGGFETMASKADEIKAKITEIGNDITEIDGDLQEIIDKINSTPGDGLTGPETEEVLALLGETKTRTAAVAAKVPEPPTV